LDPPLATALADDLAEALSALQDLERRLRLRGAHRRKAKNAPGTGATS
jgi:hypothetical protein